MTSLHRFFRTLPRGILLISVLVVLYNEYFVYAAARWLQWNQIKCTSGNCTRLLLVADPQILGETFDVNLYNKVAIFDNDRFLRISYEQAVGHVRPDVVCFLGDLMDEGSVASTEQYKRYLQRFQMVYSAHAKHVQLMHIPGDNDIGGELKDGVTPAKVNRFKEAFAEKPYLDVRNSTRIFNVNLLTSIYPNVTRQTTPAHMSRIVVTHISLLSYPGFYTDKVTSIIEPHVVFSAHLHISRIITYPPMHFKAFTENTVLDFDLNDRMQKAVANYLEIIVPTCSYRMGVKQIGFGMAVLDNNNLHYTVLWLPNRFTYLYVYLGWLTVSVLLILVTYFRRCGVKWRTATTIKSNNIKYKRLLPS